MIILSVTVDHYISHVNGILNNLTDAGVTLKINKWAFLKWQVEYLGHMSKPRCLEIDKSNVASLSDNQPPTEETKIKSFLGLCNVFSHIIDDCTSLADRINEPLKRSTRLLQVPRPREEFIWQPYRQGLLTIGPSLTKGQSSILPWMRWRRLRNRVLDFQTHPDGELKQIGFWSRPSLPTKGELLPTGAGVPCGCFGVE